MQDNIKVLVIEPYNEPYEKVIPNTLNAKQQIVGGNIEYAYLNNDDNVALICNEEGKILGLPFNRDIGHDIIAGTFIIVGDDDSGEDKSLTKQQIDKYKNKFNLLSVLQTEDKLTEILKNRSMER